MTKLWSPALADGLLQVFRSRQAMALLDYIDRVHDEAQRHGMRLGAAINVSDGGRAE